MKLAPGTLVNDRYNIIEQIGCGGMANVYRAKDEKLARDVTFKVLKEEHLADNEFIKRFNVEARAAASLSHQNIVNVYDVGNDGDIYFIVMEYIDGCTLKELINQKAPFGNKEVISISLQVASALAHAHANGIVHRDIKPQNILVSGAGKNAGCVKVTDFGIARAASSSTTNSGDAMGSVQYFSPEQAKGGFVDAKSDIYSLGIMMFEMLTGTLPFDGDTPVALAMKHIKEPLPDIAKINPNASKSLIKIIEKATKKRPYERYQTAGELSNDLRAALNDDSGSFVKSDGGGSDGSNTIKISAEEMNKIRNADSKKNVPNLGENEDIYNDIDDDYNPRDDGYDKNKERKAVFAAVITSILLIAVLTVAGVFVVNEYKNPKVKVPNFVGLTAEDAEKLAQENEINIAEESENSEEIAEGVVISQSVDENTKMLKSDRLTLVISLGSGMIEVPNVKELSAADAKLSLEQSGLVLGQTISEASDTVIEGAVIKQSIEAGDSVEPGTSVDIYVSTGVDSATVIVPNVLDIEQAKAVEMLEQEKLVVKTIEDYNDTYEKGKVTNQSVDPGLSVPKGYIVTITVSKGKDPNAVTEATTQTTTQAVTVTQAPQKKSVSIPVVPDFTSLGLAEEENPTVIIKVIAKTTDNSRTVIEGSYSKSDFPFTVNDQIDKNTTYEVYCNDTLINSVDESY